MKRDVLWTRSIPNKLICSLFAMSFELLIFRRQSHPSSLQNKANSTSVSQDKSITNSMACYIFAYGTGSPSSVDLILRSLAKPASLGMNFIDLPAKGSRPISLRPRLFSFLWSHIIASSRPSAVVIETARKVYIKVSTSASPLYTSTVHTQSKSCCASTVMRSACSVARATDCRWGQLTQETFWNWEQSNNKK